MKRKRYALTDMPLACARCEQTFIFSAGEQELQALRGIRQRPEHCRTCTLQLRGSIRATEFVTVPV